jgi:hypothetical protein
VRIAIALLFAGGASLAFGAPFTVVGGGGINNAAWNFANGGGLAPVFDASHNLITIGNNLGTVGAVIPPQSNSGGNFPGTISQCINLGGGCGIIPAPFGTATTAEFSGNYFIGFYFAISDPTAADGTASITYAGAGNSGANQITFTNTSGGPVMGYVGAVLAIHGFFGGQANAVVGAALDGAISWNGGAPQEATVVLFGSSLAGQPTSVFAAGVGATNGTYFNCGFAFGCNDFIAWGVSLLNGGQQITIPNGQTLTLNGALSVIADPPISSGIFSLDPRTTVTPGTILPDFGAAGSTPEPSTLALVGGALLALVWKRRARPRA